MRTLLAVLGGACLLFALGALAVSRYTAHKLEAGRMARGDIPGATFVDAEVLDYHALQYQCELSLRVVIDGSERTVRDWAEEPACSTMEIGSHTPMARLPGDHELYLKNGTWASPGNGRFDEGLLAVERLIAAIAAALALGAAIALVAGVGRQAKR
jgi:hypothetical protein